MPADLLIYALVAAGLVFWLRSILGTRHGGERERPNPLLTPKLDIDPSVPSSTALGQLPSSETPIINPLTLPKNSNCSIANPALEPVLLNIASQDRRFTLAHFATASQDVFVMIVEAFSHGNRDLLKTLLAPDLFKSFDDALTARVASGETMSAEIHSIRKMEITDARITDKDREKMAYITVRFVADETVVTRNKEGQILFGHPDRVTETIDIWTFGKSVSGKDPTWFLIATREEENSPVPTPPTNL